MRILDEGRKAVARLLGGDMSMAVGGVYIEYTNDPLFEPGVVPADRERDYYADLAGDEGYVRALGVSTPVVFESGDDIKASFTALSDGEVMNGPGMVDGVSRVYAVALVATPVPSDPTKDVVLFAGNLQEPITKAANAQFGARATVVFPADDETSE